MSGLLSTKMIYGDLGNKIEKLKSRAEDVKTRLTVEEMQHGKKRKREVDSWLRNVQEIELEVNSSARKSERSWFSFSKTPAKKAESMLARVEELLKGGQFQQGLVLDDLESKGIWLLGPQFKDQASEKVVDLVWNCLTEEDELRVGICGMGGVGKTTLALHINNRIINSASTFNHVYWVTVSRETNTHKLQSDIAREIKLGLSNVEDERMRASLLSEAIKRNKRSLIILDDVWKPISMVDVGVPIDAGICKLLITSRSISTCRKMKCKEFKVHPLPINEAWKLFMNELVNYEALSVEVKKIAKVVAKECDGLPLGIIVMAGCMRGIFDICEWRTALRDLQDSTPFEDEVEDRVFRILYFSYARLENEKLQQCFQFWALYPEDFMIDKKELVRCFIAQGLVDTTRKLEEQVDEGFTIINQLENSCLLELVYDDYVKMHDLLRDMMVNIMKKKGAIIKAGTSLKKIPAEESWTSDITRVSLMCNEIVSIEPLAWTPECPQLSTLLLQNNPLTSIAESFFIHMMGLKFLNLSNTKIVLLPDIISELRNLRALLLRACNQLVYIPSLAKLKALRMLDLSGSYNIQKMPDGIENLVNLEYFVLGDDQFKGKVHLPIGTVQGLSSLEVIELLVDESTMDQKELIMLENMKRFRGVVYGYNCCSQFARSRQNESTNHSLGNENMNMTGYFNKAMDMRNNNSFDDEDNHCPCEGPEVMEFDHLHDYKSSFDLEITLPQCGSFKDLTMLNVSMCAKINSLFPLDSLNHLPSLEYVCVSSCENLKILFETREDNYGQGKLGGAITLPNLRWFSLWYLPALTDVCRETIICDHLSFVCIRSCTSLKRIPFSIQEPPSSKDIQPEFQTDKSHWNSFEWYDLSTKEKFTPILPCHCD